MQLRKTRTVLKLLTVSPTPILKWVGGKRSVINDLIRLMPKRYSTYVEPFLGGGALFFSLTPSLAIISDANRELIDCYRTVRDNPNGLIEILKMHRYDKEYYYALRAIDPEDLTAEERAARTIYLNRTGFNGLYRVNRRGKFNVPFGRHSNPKILNQENIFACSNALQGVIIENFKFEEFPWGLLTRGDFVYLDPPYVPLSKTSSFTAYQGSGFGDADQVKLAEIYSELTQKGVKCLLSNSDTKRVRKLYKDFKLVEIKAPRFVNSKGDGRGAVSELAVLNY